MNPFRRKKKAHKESQKRSLFLETLEERVLYSAAPVADAPQPEAQEVVVANNDGAEAEDAATSGSSSGRISLAIPERQAADGVSSINIQFNYDYDGGFFSGENESRRTELERAAAALETWILDDLAKGSHI